MSNAKHTPGPWFIVDSVNGDWPTGCEICIDNVEGGNPDTDYCIASAVHGDPEKLKANARLIATAPDLLDALETLVEHFEYYMGDNECRPLENARAAIAKARGTD